MVSRIGVETGKLGYEPAMPSIMNGKGNEKQYRTIRPSRCPMPNDEKASTRRETSIDIDDLDGGHLRVMGIVSETETRCCGVYPWRELTVVFLVYYTEKHSNSISNRATLPSGAGKNDRCCYMLRRGTVDRAGYGRGV